MNLDLRMSFSFVFLSRDFCSAIKKIFIKVSGYVFGKNGFRANNRFMLNFFHQRSARPPLSPYRLSCEKKYSFLVLPLFTQQMREET